MTLVRSSNTLIIHCFKNIFHLLIGLFCSITKMLDYSVFCRTVHIIFRSTSSLQTSFFLFSSPYQFTDSALVHVAQTDSIGKVRLHCPEYEILKNSSNILIHSSHMQGHFTEWSVQTSWTVFSLCHPRFLTKVLLLSRLIWQQRLIS